MPKGKQTTQNWQIAKFEDVLDYIQPTNFIVESTDYNDNYKTPVLTAGKSFIKGYTNESKGIFNSLPVIIFDDFTTANKFVNFPFKVKSSAMKILKPKNENVNIKFVFYYMQTVRVTFDTHKRYWISVFAKEKIPLPSLNDQNAIVAKIEELFSELDKGIENLKLAQEQLKTYRQSVLNKLITGKNMLSIESVIDKLDQGWSPKCENQRSINNNEWAVIKTSAVQHGYFLDIENKKLPKNLKPRVQHELQIGDVLITRAGPRIRVGVCCLVKTTRPKLINCDKVYRIKVNKRIITPEYFEFILNTPNYQSEIEIMKTGISDSGLNLTQKGFLKIEIPVPSIEEQNNLISEMTSHLQTGSKLEEIIAQNLQQAEVLKQSILKKAFEGELINEIKEEVFKPKNIYFYQMQVLALIAKASKEKDISHGEMTLAKYSYLIDKLCGVPTYYDYKRWHLGPYPVEMKKAINNKEFFKIENYNIEPINEKRLFKYENSLKDKIQSAVYELSTIFSKYKEKERSRKIELLATVCKVVEDIKTTDLKSVRDSMKNWTIELKTTKLKNKAQKFGEEETKKCLEFLVGKGWDIKLITTIK